MYRISVHINWVSSSSMYQIILWKRPAYDRSIISYTHRILNQRQLCVCIICPWDLRSDIIIHWRVRRWELGQIIILPKNNFCWTVSTSLEVRLLISSPILKYRYRRNWVLRHCLSMINKTTYKYDLRWPARTRCANFHSLSIDNVIRIKFCIDEPFEFRYNLKANIFQCC